jgi:hypothetical protein
MTTPNSMSARLYVDANGVSRTRRDGKKITVRTVECVAKLQKREELVRAGHSYGENVMAATKRAGAPAKKTRRKRRKTAAARKTTRRKTARRSTARSKTARRKTARRGARKTARRGGGRRKAAAARRGGRRRKAGGRRKKAAAM